MESASCELEISKISVTMASSSSPSPITVETQLHSDANPQPAFAAADPCVCPDPSAELSEVPQPTHGDLNGKQQSPVVSMAMKDHPLRSKLAFMQSYVYSLLPELRRIHSQPPPFSLKEKLSAVRRAADTSLAISATGNHRWRHALLRHATGFSRSFKGRMRGKLSVRKPSVLSKRIYTKILRSSEGSVGLSSHRRAGPRRGAGSAPPPSLSSAADHCHPVASFMGLSSAADHRHPVASFMGLSSAADHRHTVASFMGSSCGATMGKSTAHLDRAKPVGLRRSGFSSHVRSLRESMAPRNTTRMKLPIAAPCSPSLPRKEQITSLGRLIPGGCSMDVPLLLEEAADYIRSMEMQVEALHCLSHLISS